MTTSKQIKETGKFDTVSHKAGVFTVRRGFFYTKGKTSYDLAQTVRDLFPTARVVDHGEVRKPFNGGASTAQSSHWWVKFTIAQEVAK